MKNSNNNRNTKGIKGWPESERPRELLLEKGPEADLTPLDHLIIGPTGYVSLKDDGVSFNE